MLTAPSSGKLLYITQVIPMPTGSGLAMRAYQVLKALSSRYSVYLLIIGRSVRQRSIESDFPMCRKIQYVPAKPLSDRDLLLRLLLYKLRPRGFVDYFSQPLEWCFISQKRIEAVARSFGDLHFDVIHTFRLYTTPFAKPFFSRSDFQQLDLDDIDSETRQSIGRLHQENGEGKDAALNYHEARLYAEIERTTLPEWKRVFVCSSLDKNKLHQMYGHPDIQVLPNVIPLPHQVMQKQPDKTFRFLFVGNFYYYPNREAILYFCNQILPLLRKTIRLRFVVCIAGAGLGAKVTRRLNQIPEVEIVGFHSDLQQLYRNSNAVIIPIRAGGGTRIKVLEAFCFQLPVISTTIGIEGIDAQNEKHCLVGDTAEAFAQQCIRIIREPELGLSLAKNAFDLVQDRYSPQILTQEEV